MYIIRADGNVKIGAGHLMRCLTIAEALANRIGGKQEICFFCADEESAALAESNGFRSRVFGTDYRDMEAELPQWEKWLAEEEMLQDVGNRDEGRRGEECRDAVESSCVCIILVDSYYVNDTYLQALRRYGKVYLLDDLQEHTYPADVVINYNAFADEEIYCKLYTGTGTECLVGSDYVPVRQQFLNRDYCVAEAVEDVLITTGGGDRDNIAGRILETIYCQGIRFHVVTGRYNPHLEELKKLEDTCPGVHIYHDVKDMAGLMQKCDLAITAGGTTIYELAAIGVPFLCFSYAKNQEALTEHIGANEIAGFLGAYHLDEQAVLERLQVMFAEYCESLELRKACYEKEREMIDGKGTERLAERLYRQNCI